MTPTINFNLWMQLLHLPAENKHCCSNYKNKKEKKQIKTYTQPNTHQERY